MGMKEGKRTVAALKPISHVFQANVANELQCITLYATIVFSLFQGMPAHLKKIEEFPRYTQKLEIKVIYFNNVNICAGSIYIGNDQHYIFTTKLEIMLLGARVRACQTESVRFM